jgi:hypothetical protein
MLIETTGSLREPGRRHEIAGVRVRPGLADDR